MNNYIVGTPLIDLTSPHCCACPKPGHGFLTPYVVVFLVFNDLRSEVVVRFFLYWKNCLSSLFKFSFYSKVTELTYRYEYALNFKVNDLNESKHEIKYNVIKCSQLK